MENSKKESLKISQSLKKRPECEKCGKEAICLVHGIFLCTECIEEIRKERNKEFRNKIITE
jgi:ribosomal protein L37AE/L43A